MSKIYTNFRTKPTNFIIVLCLFSIIPVSIYYIFFPPHPQKSCYPLEIKNNELNDRISLGNKTLLTEKILISKNTNQNTIQPIQQYVNIKQKGTQYFTEGKCDEAEGLFKEVKNNFRNDPENVIYLNNVQVGKNPLKIAVSVPIVTKPDIAQEILRGVAYAQDEINKTGIDQRKLLVEIINDDNDLNVVKKVAEELVNDREILAVIGHNKSTASMIAAEVYKDKLVMVSPTSTADNLSNYNNFIFRSIFPSEEMTPTLAEYAIKTAKNKIAICYYKKDISSQSLTGNFIMSFTKVGGKIVALDCNLSDPNFNAAKTVDQAIRLGANGLFLDPDLDKLDVVINLANVNQGRLTLFGDPTLYTGEILNGQVEGLVLVSPWHPDINVSFARKMKDFWGGSVNWRTATAYDATKAVIAGLQKKQTRVGLQQVLESRDFTAMGQNGEIKFNYISGDRMGTPILVKVSNGQFQQIR
ncbi:ABC transporter substrate-binding protein [Trichormus variabilis]|nr:ABC transporter substrate-binding protein [Trichormus variabilis]MBD2626573.1 amino acid ABC transporter substrate-binding protein [Trichormus variabilis FACHB-164]